MHAVYKCHDKDNRLLYVGVGSNALTRIQSHQKEKPWFDNVSRIDVIQYKEREDAMFEESRSIREDKPLYNRLGNTDSTKVHMENYKMFMRRMKFTWVQLSHDHYFYFKDVIDHMLELGLIEQEGKEYSYKLVNFAE